MSIRERLPRFFNTIPKSYASNLGFKIAASVAVFTVVPILIHVFLHEYLSDGKAQLYKLLIDPSLWWIILMSFVALMMVLSKIVILPLKKLELHISEIEKGIKNDPFVIETNDEISYLVRRFNSLHRTVLNEIESRDVHLSVIYEFTNSTAGIFDIPMLMDVFFKTLRTAVEFETGAYVICSNGIMEGRIYSAVGELGHKEAEQVTGRLVAAARSYCHNFDGIDRLGVTVVGNASEKLADTPKHFVNLPITCKGGTVGIVSLIYPGEVDPVLGSKVFSAMVMHANTVIEKLLSHLSEKGKRLSLILSSMSEGVYLINKHGDATCVNRKGLELVSGWCSRTMDCARKGFMGCVCPDCEFSKVLDKLRALGPGFVDKVHTEEIRDRSGRIIQLSASALEAGGGDEGGFVITAKDVTEERMVQKRVMLSSKFAALGEMAAGVAHEVNNPLQWMMANVELLEGSVAPSGAKRIGQLREGILRIKAIVRDLLIFAREQTTETEAVDINPILRKVGEMLGHQLKMVNVDLEFDLVQRGRLL